MSRIEIRALTFDVFGTVVDWRNSIAREGATWGPKKGLDIDWFGFADAWRGLYQPAMEKVRESQMGWVNLDALHRMNLDQLSNQFGLDVLNEDDLNHLNQFWHRLDPWPDAVTGMERLRQKFILASLSNGNVALMVNMAKRAGIPWDMILGAEVAGHYKPQPEAYSISVELLGLKPQQALMVAAHNGDLVAAAKVGLRTAFVRRPTEYGSNQKLDIEPEHKFDFVADDFLDLADQLGC